MKISFLLPARRELNDAVCYYNGQQGRLGDEFRDEAWDTLHRIMQFPFAWQTLGGTIRRCRLRRFPYGIIDEPSALEIVIIAIAHLHQEPDYWRLPV